MSASRDVSSPPLWAITSYFNPMHFQRRLEGYRLFRQRLNVPLITVELSLDGKFELDSGPGNTVVRVSGSDVMWHKERLLNIALSAVPAGCRKIAWLDCDVIFTDTDWANRTCEALNRFVLVQPFREVRDLAREARPEDLDLAPQQAPVERTGHGLAYGLAVGAIPDGAFNPAMRVQGWYTGLAWAGRREVLDADGFYDACILGSGNRAMVCAALGRFDEGVSRLQMSPPWIDHYMAWARPHFESVRGDIGFAEGTILHLWHGDVQNRRYADRHRDMSAFQFDPSRDIAAENQGCWRWSSDKPRMHEYVRQYFAARKEDG